MAVTEKSRHAGTLKGTQTAQLVLTLAKTRAGFRQIKGKIPCAVLPTCLECGLSWAGRAGHFWFVYPLYAFHRTGLQV